MAQQDENFEIMAYEIAILLEGVLHYAGVKAEKMEAATQKYVEIVDDVLENSAAAGVEEVIEVVEFMRKTYPEFF